MPEQTGATDAEDVSLRPTVSGHDGPVRRCGVADAQLLARLLWDFDTEFGTGPDPVEVLARRFTRVLREPQVVALVAGVVGFALLTTRPTVWYDGSVAQLEELYVAPGHRGRGVGSDLLTQARRHVLRRGCPEIHISVDEVDDGARRFYERHGFVNVEREVDGRMLAYVGSSAPAGEARLDG